MIFKSVFYYCRCNLLNLVSEGRNIVKIPSIGNKLINFIVGNNPKLSASPPITKEPIAPIPKASPTVKPDIVPIIFGTNSCAYTTVTEKLAIKIKPIIKSRIKHTVGFVNGSRAVKGTAPTIESKMIVFLPKRSAKGPPKKVPSAPASKKAKI